MNIVIRTSRRRLGLLLVVSLVFVAAGVYILEAPISGGENPASRNLAAWFGILFFGFGALVFIWQIIRSRPRLMINDEGIVVSTLGVGFIPWSDIQGACLRSISRNDFICLDLRDTERYLQRIGAAKRALASANAALGFTPITINLSAVDADSEEVLEIIIKRIQRPGGRI